MKAKFVAASIGALIIGGTIAAQAGWLRAVYTGEFCAHGHKYAATVSGTYIVQTEHTNQQYESCAGMGCTGNLVETKAWGTDITFKDLTDLDNVIEDLKKMSDEAHKVLGPTSLDESDCDNDGGYK